MKKALISVAAGMAALFASTSANALELEITSISSLAGAPTGTIRNNGTSYTTNLGPQKVVGKLGGVDTSFLAYCVELIENSGTGTFQVVTLSDYLKNFYSPSSAQYRTNLISDMLGANGASASVTTQTALQLAIWELRYERQSDLFDLRDDQFKVTSSGLSSYINAANALYADSGELAKGTYEFFVATSDGYYKESGKHKKTWVEGKQDLLFYTFTPANAVPEPATWAMMIGGFGLAGAAMRRRKTSVSFA